MTVWWWRHRALMAATIGLTAVASCLAYQVFLWATDGRPTAVHSYQGGVAYVLSREEDPLTGQAATPARLIAGCQAYVDAGMHRLDGYPLGAWFIAGCADTANRWPR